jgi:hypothetical protein
MNAWFRPLLLLIAALCLTPATAQAHKPSDSYLGLRMTESGIAGEWKISLRDLDYAIGLDGNDDGAITWGELRARHSDIAAYALSRLRIAGDETACAAEPGEQLVDTLSDGAYTVLRFAIDCGQTPQSLRIDYSLFFDLDPQHRGLVRLDAEVASQTAIFGPDQSRQRFDLAAASPLRQFAAYVHEGVWHIWIGYDHVLFVVTLLLPAVLRRRPEGWTAVADFRTAFLQVVGIVSAFTLAHSFTLSLAALGLIGLPSRLVESVIAASIAIAALNNIYPLVTRRLWLVALAFGLAHGFGFASVLADLGLPRDALLLSLVAFNLGVEIGQLAIVAALLPLIYGLCRWRHYPRAVLQGGSLAIVSIAALWFVERAFDVTLMQ